MLIFGEVVSCAFLGTGSNSFRNVSNNNWKYKSFLVFQVKLWPNIWRSELIKDNRDNKNFNAWSKKQKTPNCSVPKNRVNVILVASLVTEILAVVIQPKEGTFSTLQFFLNSLFQLMPCKVQLCFSLPARSSQWNLCINDLSYLMTEQ